MFAGALALAASLSIEAVEIEKNLEQTFPVTPGAKLTIHADRGGIELKVGADDKIEVKVYRKARAGSTAQAEEMLAAHEVTFRQEGNQVFVEAKAPTLNGKWSWRGRSLEVRFEANVPRQLSPDLHTAGGSIRLPDLAGAVRTQTAGGSIRIGRIEGPVWARTAGGSISVAAATEAVDAETAGGSIDVGDAGATVRLRTAGGSIDVGKVQGRSDAGTAGGGIRIREARAAVRARTAGGSVSVALAATPEEDCEIETAAGGIDLRVPPGLAANLDAETSAGSVTCDLPVTVQGKLKRSSLQGKIGEGGHWLRLRTSAGSIRIKSSGS